MPGFFFFFFFFLGAGGESCNLWVSLCNGAPSLKYNQVSLKRYQKQMNTTHHHPPPKNPRNYSGANGHRGAHQSPLSLPRASNAAVFEPTSPKKKPGIEANICIMYTRK
jgi:hypothetical protein